MMRRFQKERGKPPDPELQMTFDCHHAIWSARSFQLNTGGASEARLVAKASMCRLKSA
jgi:hypothetical protein